MLADDRCYFDLANIQLRMGDMTDALSTLRKCLCLRKESMPRNQVTAFTLHKIGDAMFMEGDCKASM